MSSSASNVCKLLIVQNGVKWDGSVNQLKVKMLPQSTLSMNTVHRDKEGSPYTCSTIVYLGSSACLSIVYTPENYSLNPTTQKEVGPPELLPQASHVSLSTQVQVRIATSPGNHKPVCTAYTHTHTHVRTCAWPTHSHTHTHTHSHTQWYPVNKKNKTLNILTSYMHVMK